MLDYSHARFYEVAGPGARNDPSRWEADVDRIMIGEAEVFRIVEWKGRVASPRTAFPDIPAQEWEDNRAMLLPDYWDPDTNGWIATCQIWVVRIHGRTVLVDTGVGNAKHGVPSVFEDWDTDFLARLADAGVRTEDVDVVINTHLHPDHVGWNTMQVHGHWVPTFPNATYLIPSVDMAWAQGEELYTASIAPILDAGLAHPWSGSHRIDDNLVLDAAPGHTPGNAIVYLNSDDQNAVFVGDMVHMPLQILNPLYNSGFCADPVLARKSRLRVLGEAAESRAWVIPAHFGGSGALRVHRKGDCFAISVWAQFTP